MAEPTRRARANWAAILVLGLLSVAFVASAWPQITGPFADSDEGINGAVWGYNSRSLRELGPLTSHLGGVRIDGTKYATHPPLIVVETAVFESVLGEHPWSTRASAWVGALASIVLVYLLLRDVPVEPAVAAAATAAAMACHMVFVYGAMVDTMVIALPFALAVALLWHRQWTGMHPPSPWIVLGVAVPACLGGWQVCLLAGLCGASLVARFRSRPHALGQAAPYLGAAVLGVGATLGWAYWVYGSFDVLGDKLVRRSGGEAATVTGMIGFQLPWLGQLLGVGLLAWIAAAMSLRDRRFRPLAALSLTSVVLYAVLLKEGSGGHQYWNYWGVFPAAVGFAYGFDALAAVLVRRFGRQTAAPAAILVVLAVVVAVVNLAQPNEARDLIVAGYRPYDLVDATPLAPGQTDIPYLAEPFRADDWLRYRGGPPGRPLRSAEDLRVLAAEHPAHQVLVLGSCAVPDPTGICERVTLGPTGISPGAGTVAPRFETAAVLAEQAGVGP
jgi:hypothetical protein